MGAGPDKRTGMASTSIFDKGLAYGPAGISRIAVRWLGRATGTG